MADRYAPTRALQQAICETEVVAALGVAWLDRARHQVWPSRVKPAHDRQLLVAMHVRVLRGAPR
jgi:hypothetical protein